MRMLPYADFVISTIDATFIPKEKKKHQEKKITMQSTSMTDSAYSSAKAC